MTRRRRLQVLQAVGVLLFAGGLILSIWETTICGLIVIITAAILRRRHG